MSRPTHNHKPRIKPSTVFRGMFVCFNNRARAYGCTIEDAFKKWEAVRELEKILNE